MMKRSRLSLQDVTAIARDVVREAEHEVIGAVPGAGESDYAELFVALNTPAGFPQRVSIGVHRGESPEFVREEIAQGLRAVA